MDNFKDRVAGVALAGVALAGVALAGVALADVASRERPAGCESSAQIPR